MTVSDTFDPVVEARQLVRVLESTDPIDLALLESARKRLACLELDIPYAMYCEGHLHRLFHEKQWVRIERDSHA